MSLYINWYTREIFLFNFKKKNEREKSVTGEFSGYLENGGNIMKEPLDKTYR